MTPWLFYSIANFAGWWLLMRNNSFTKLVFGMDKSPTMSFVVFAWVVGFTPHLQIFALICLLTIGGIAIIAYLASRFGAFFGMTLSEFEKRIFEKEGN